MAGHEDCEQHHAHHYREIGDLKVVTHGIAKDIEYIKDKIDNGLSDSIDKTYNAVLGIQPVVKAHEKWLDRIKWAFVWITVIAVGGGLATIGIDFAKNALMGG